MDARVECKAAHGLFQAPRSVFQEAWWLEIVGQGRGYREERVLRNGTVVGLLPSDPGGRFGIIWGGAPHWSHLCGPLIAPGLPPEAKREVIRQLVRKLRRGISHCYTMNYDYPDADLVRAEFERANFISMSRQRLYNSLPIPT
jgi:hypothetical protein